MVEIFNNNHNTFEEVIDVLMKSTGCGVEEAYIETWEAHHFGKAAVHFGSEQECREAARIINRVGVHTYVGREWIE
jgi:ATP-dependent Clp protease adapter protein ClpS